MRLIYSYIHKLRNIIDQEVRFTPPEYDVRFANGRYGFSSHEAYELLSKKQKYPIEKIRELADMGYGTVQSITKDLFGSPRSEAKGKELHTKLKWDLIGY